MHCVIKRLHKLQPLGGSKMKFQSILWLFLCSFFLSSSFISPVLHAKSNVGAVLYRMPVLSTQNDSISLKKGLIEPIKDVWSNQKTLTLITESNYKIQLLFLSLSNLEYTKRALKNGSSIDVSRCEQPEKLLWTSSYNGYIERYVYSATWSLCSVTTSTPVISKVDSNLFEATPMNEKESSFRIDSKKALQ